MKNSIIKSVLCAMATIPCIVFAHPNITGFSNDSDAFMIPNLFEGHCQLSNGDIEGFELRGRQHVPEKNSDNIRYSHVVLSESGTLASVLGESILEIDSISVEGPVNAVDFNTLWESSFKGRLKIINLEHAIVENGIIPDDAFFHKDVQVDWGTMVISTIWLEKLFLPEGVTDIGSFAVAYATGLKEIKIPTTLRTIGKSAFTDCIGLTVEQLEFPENLSVIGSQAFYNCTGLNGRIRLPESLHVINCGSFYHCRISEINIPNSLEFLGCMAFAGSRFKEAFLPDDCMLCEEGGQFYNNWELTDVHLPDKLSFVPDGVFSECKSLKHANVPSMAITIDDFAFDNTSISAIDLPQGLESIGLNAFQSCHKLNTVVLPSSLKSIGDRAFALCTGLKSIYCMATVPPKYFQATEYESGTTPFASVDSSIPVYIPIGTKEQYMKAPGWDYMTNFVETDDFPWAGIDCIVTDNDEDFLPIYDLWGRKVAAPVRGGIYIRNGMKFIQR